jgi:Glycosyltransferase like family 2
MTADDQDVPSCSVVICTRDRPEHLDRCLKAVAALEYSRFDVLVVDNAPSSERACEVADNWKVNYKVNYTVEPKVGLAARETVGPWNARVTSSHIWMTMLSPTRHGSAV